MNCGDLARPIGSSFPILVDLDSHQIYGYPLAIDQTIIEGIGIGATASFFCSGLAAFFLMRRSVDLRPETLIVDR